MNTTNISQAANNANNFNSINAGIIQFPIQSKANQMAQKGWICNLSEHYVFSQQHHEYLQIQPSKQHTQFNLICRLLEADTCRVIYFDDQLTKGQLALLRDRHIGSRTELLHAKVAHLFAKEVSTLYA
ncbi:MAG: hypothetical protein ACJAVV_000400 [Alphaproteobacteria bacterium]|jgi:hypothetical protein